MYTLIINVIPAVDTFTPHLLAVWDDMPSSSQIMQEIAEWGGPIGMDGSQPVKNLEGWQYSLNPALEGRVVEVILRNPHTGEQISYGQVQPADNAMLRHPKSACQRSAPGTCCDPNSDALKSGRKLFMCPACTEREIDRKLNDFLDDGTALVPGMQAYIDTKTWVEEMDTALKEDLLRERPPVMIISSDEFH